MSAHNVAEILACLTNGSKLQLQNPRYQNGKWRFLKDRLDFAHFSGPRPG
jgi:hypothetical protein